MRAREIDRVRQMCRSIGYIEKWLREIKYDVSGISTFNGGKKTRLEVSNYQLKIAKY